MRIVSWNIHQLDEAWRQLATDPSLDVALLQEAKPPPADVKYEVVPARGANWKMPRYRRAFRTSEAAAFFGAGHESRNRHSQPAAAHAQRRFSAGILRVGWTPRNTARRRARWRLAMGWKRTQPPRHGHREP
jgi:hypothetical protein